MTAFKISFQLLEGKANVYFPQRTTREGNELPTLQLANEVGFKDQNG